MFSWMFNPINGFIKFIHEDVYLILVEWAAYLVEYLTLGAIRFTILTVQFSWDIAKTIIDDMGLNDQLNQAWSMMDSDALNILAFFGIPEVISILLTAIVTSYVLKFIPFSGK